MLVIVLSREKKMLLPFIRQRYFEMQARLFDQSNDHRGNWWNYQVHQPAALIGIFSKRNIVMYHNYIQMSTNGPRLNLLFRHTEKQWRASDRVYNNARRCLRMDKNPFPSIDSQWESNGKIDAATACPSPVLTRRSLNLRLSELQVDRLCACERAVCILLQWPN